MSRVSIVPLIAFAIIAAAHTAAGKVRISQSSQSVAVYDFVEIAIAASGEAIANPFTDVSITGVFSKAGGEPVTMQGFADSSDGSVFRVRFMPTSQGNYSYSVTYRHHAIEQTFRGSFQAFNAHRRGPIRIDQQYPWHFIWEGTGEHYFFNGTTAYWLMGWNDERIIRYSLDRLHRLKINRVRVTLAGRTNTFYGEPVMNGSNFTVLISAWVARDANDFSHPDYDYSRFNLPYWQKWDRMLRFARDHDMIISVVLDMNDGKVHPAPGSEDERRFIRYAVARFGAFSNITWDLGDDLELFRDDQWAHATGTLLESIDAWRHLATTHPVNPVHQDRTSPWFGFTSFQDWSREQHRFMLDERQQQAATGRIIPQTNEEYGYEDHYPLWAKGLGSDSADTLRRTAWDIVMAGGYQTTGESARRGTNIWPDTGGGWMNGRGDDSMTMLAGYAHLVDFMTSFEWWKTNPHDELVTQGAYCLAEPGQIYAVYLPHGGTTNVGVQPGRYRATWFSAYSGEVVPLGDVSTGARWTSPEAPDHNDWALLLIRQ